MLVGGGGNKKCSDISLTNTHAHVCMHTHTHTNPLHRHQRLQQTKAVFTVCLLLHMIEQDMQCRSGHNLAKNWNSITPQSILTERCQAMDNNTVESSHAGFFLKALACGFNPCYLAFSNSNIKEEWDVTHICYCSDPAFLRWVITVKTIWGQQKEKKKKYHKNMHRTWTWQDGQKFVRRHKLKAPNHPLVPENNNSIAHISLHNSGNSSSAIWMYSNIKICTVQTP